MVPACYGMLTLVFLSSIIIVVDEDEDGGLRGHADVLLSYGERHLEGPPNRQESRRGVWAGVLLMCGQFERVMYFKRVEVTFPDTLQAVSALWEHQESEVEAVHLAVALAYHGLLRVPSRAETSDLTPCMLVNGSFIRTLLNTFNSNSIVCITSRTQAVNPDLAVHSPICKNGCKRGASVCLLHVPFCRSRGRGWSRTSRNRLGACQAYYCS